MLRMLSSTFARLVLSWVSRNGVQSHRGAFAGTRARSASYFSSRAASRSSTALRMRDSGQIETQTAKIAASKARAATLTTTTRSIGADNARKHQATISGGTSAGMTMGHRKGERCERASKSAATMATKPETGTMTSATTMAGLGAAPLAMAITVMIVSNGQRATIWIAA